MNQLLLTFAIIITTLSTSVFATVEAAEIRFNSLCKEAMNAPSLPLIEIHENNTNLIGNEPGRVKVARWMSEASFIKHFSNLSHTPIDREVWVTIAPEVRNFCTNFTHEANVQTHSTCREVTSPRIDLFLGLRPDRKTRKVLVEFFVDATALIRPCLNPDPNASSCSREAPSTAAGALLDMTSFLQARFGAQPGGNLDPVACLPFTGMGYTFDWGSEDNFEGATEFILLPNTPIFDLEILSFQEACGCQPLVTA